MSDLISRAAAIEYFVTNVGWVDEDDNRVGDTDELRKIWTELFDGVPSAEPKQKKGKWKLDPNGMDWNIPAWRCSECGFVASYIGAVANGLGNNPMNWAGSNFCPNCGCQMKGEEE